MAKKCGCMTGSFILTSTELQGLMMEEEPLLLEVAGLQVSMSYWVRQKVVQDLSQSFDHQKSQAIKEDLSQNQRLVCNGSKVIMKKKTLKKKVSRGLELLQELSLALKLKDQDRSKGLHVDQVQ